jgi:hypothetical protein
MPFYGSPAPVSVAASAASAASTPPASLRSSVPVLPASPPPPVNYPLGIPPTGEGIIPNQFAHLLSGNDTKPTTPITATTPYTLPPIATDKAVTKFTGGLQTLFTDSKATSIQFTISN